MISFEVRGIPQTQGSAKAFMPRGARFPVVTHDNPKLKTWRQLVASEAQRVAPPQPWAGPVIIDVFIQLQRPNGHYGKRGLLPSAPPMPVGCKGDVDKYLRGILDALTGIFWRDDGQVVCATVTKRYGAPGAIIELRELNSRALPEDHRQARLANV